MSICLLRRANRQCVCSCVCVCVCRLVVVETLDALSLSLSSLFTSRSLHPSLSPSLSLCVLLPTLLSFHQVLTTHTQHSLRPPHLLHQSARIRGRESRSDGRTAAASPTGFSLTGGERERDLGGGEVDRVRREEEREQNSEGS